ncbi:zinc finger protein 350-like [Anarrhichthys ocellatus]|uniref:zinc finger protein 350-like n=1 Tax=Anarrhichthys ocellatus TaxID=433405 RepID=UPI0012ED5748|nr:zinc finger protein 350-like [Anarrhichthys ocellatus]
MADFSSWVTPLADGPAVRVVSAGKASSSSIRPGNGSWGAAGGMDQITVVRIDDTHIAEERSVKATAAACYEVEYSMPTEEEEAEEEEDGVYVIEYSNPEEEGESYQFMMSVDRSLPALKHPAVSENATAPPLPPSPLAKLSQRPRQKRKPTAEEEARRRKQQQQFVSNKCVLELGEDYRDAMDMSSDREQLVCTLCPPPGRSFKRASGLAVHLKHMHLLEGNKKFFCTTCKQPVRTQIELDAHTKRHANQSAVFSCLLCPETAGYRGSRQGLRRHLEQEHPGVVPRCHVCNKGFTSLVSYLADQFRHVGVSPYFCARCQIYEMTERGLNVHIRNHDKKKKELQQQESSTGNLPLTFGGGANADNSATDDSDF